MVDEKIILRRYDKHQQNLDEHREEESELKDEVSESKLIELDQYW